MPEFDADRVRNTSNVMRTIVRLHAAIADNKSIADRFPSRAAAARKRIAEARRELTRAQVELADMLLA